MMKRYKVIYFDPSVYRKKDFEGVRDLVVEASEISTAWSEFERLTGNRYHISRVDPVRA